MALKYQTNDVQFVMMMIVQFLNCIAFARRLGINLSGHLEKSENVASCSSRYAEITCYLLEC